MASRKRLKQSGKQKKKQLSLLSDPVAAAALDALSSSSDDDVDPPIIENKNKRSSSRAKKVQKPLFGIGDLVSAAWWPNEKFRRMNKYEWFPGKIKSFKEIDNSSPYGPTRKYHIEFDHNDELEDVEDHLIFSKNEYNLTMKDNGKTDWYVGVKNVVDEKSTDLWASVVGWYVATIDGQEQSFSLLSDAVEAYDNNIVRLKGKNTKPSDLNLPNKWGWLFENSESDGDSEQNNQQSEGKGKRKSAGPDPKDGQTEINFQAFDRNDTGTPYPLEDPRGKIGKKSNESASPAKLQKLSIPAYHGVSYSEQDRKYLAQVNRHGKLHCLGYYKFSADAGLAADKGAFLGLLPEFNFSTRKDYENAIQKEMENSGRTNDAESYEAVVKKVGVYLSKIYASKINSSDTQLGNNKEDVEMDGLANEGSTKNDNKPDSSSGAQSDGEKGKNRLHLNGDSDGENVADTVLGDVKTEKDSDSERKLTSDSPNNIASDSPKSKKCESKSMASRMQGESHSSEGTAIEPNPQNEFCSKEANEDLDGDIEMNASSNISSSNNGNNIGSNCDVSKPNDGNHVADTLLVSSNIKEVADDSIKRKVPCGTQSKIKQSQSNKDVPGPKRKKRTRYFCIQYDHRNGGRYLPYFKHRVKSKTKLKYLGSFKLEADAALARDEAMRLLQGQNHVTKPNFATMQDHEKVVNEELERTGLAIDNAMPKQSIVDKVTQVISKLDPSSIDLVLQRQPVIVPDSKSKNNSSSFTGVSCNKQGGKYNAQINHDRKAHNIGSYHLESDAALAYDEAAKLIRGVDCSKINFASGKDYMDARTNELGKFELTSELTSVATLAEVSTKIQKHLSKIPCPEIIAINNAMAKKWACYLPSETGNEFLVYYQKDIDDVLARFHTTDRNSAEPSVVSNNVDDKPGSAEIESIQVENPGTFFKPILEGTADDSSARSQYENVLRKTSKHLLTRSEQEPAGCADGDTSRLSGPGETSDLGNARFPLGPDTLDDHSPNSNTENMVNDAASSTNQSEKPDQTKEFPIGCSVLWNFDSINHSFSRGRISSAPTYGADKDVVHEVTPIDSSGRNLTSKQIPAKELAFGLNCPVYVKPSNGCGSLPRQGEILICSPSSGDNLQADSFSYTILITDGKDGNQLQVMKDIPSERVKYRKLESELSRPATKDVAPECKHEPQAKQPSGLSPVHNKAAEENESRSSSHQFFSSNSTITTVDSRAGTNAHENGVSVYSRVYLPRWLVHDSTAKHGVMTHLRRVGKRGMQCWQRISTKPNCFIRIIDEGDGHVLIKTKAGKHASESTRRANVLLENSLLECIHHDGSCGRLFYDLAQRCRPLHQQGTAGSVMQRNPFSRKYEMGWMDIVELPYIREEGGKRYHGHYLIAKNGGVLGKIKHETGCKIKLCGNEFKVPTQFCAPYVCIIGDQQDMVMRAVTIVRDAIQRHVQRCNCAF